MYGYTVSGEMTDEERERLILEHLPQVRLIARRIQERLPDSISLDDLVSTGVLGLISAIDNFDPVHNVKLKTYAEYKIRGAILDSLRGLDWAPRQKRRKSKQIEAAIAIAEQRLQGPPIGGGHRRRARNHPRRVSRVAGGDSRPESGQPGICRQRSGQGPAALPARHRRESSFRAAGTGGTGEAAGVEHRAAFRKSRRPCSASTTTKN